MLNFPGPPAELELSDVLVRLRTDQTANTCSWQRRDACRRLLAFLFLVISDCIEASLRSKLWSETKVEQLKQLRTRLRGLCFVLGFVLPLFFGLLNDRTARGYRQVSFGFRQAIVERTKNAKMQDSGTVEAAQEILVEGRSASKQHRAAPRYNYMKAGEELMKDSPMVSLAADAVSVASDHILNCFLWHPVQKKAVHLPPQVPRLGIT